MKAIQLTEVNPLRYINDKLNITVKYEPTDEYEAVLLITKKGAYDLIEVYPNVFSGMCHTSKVTVNLNNNTLKYN